MLKKLILLGVFLIPFMFSAQENIKIAQSKIAVIPSVGYAWRLSKISDEIPTNTKNYFKGLNSGIDISVGSYYLLTENNSIGIKYSGYFASSEGSITVQNSNNEYVSEFMSTKDNISFIGGSYMYSDFQKNSNHKLFFTISLGIMTYNTKTANVKNSASSLAGEFNFGYQYAINNHIFIGPKVGLTGGTLRKMKYNGTTVDSNTLVYNGTSVNFGNEEEKEGFTRLSLSTAATFRF